MWVSDQVNWGCLAMKVRWAYLFKEDLSLNTLDLVANLFEPSVDAAVTAIKRQIEASNGIIRSVFVVGGYAASPWLFQYVAHVYQSNVVQLTILLPKKATSRTSEAPEGDCQQARHSNLQGCCGRCCWLLLRPSRFRTNVKVHVRCWVPAWAWPERPRTPCQEEQTMRIAFWSEVVAGRIRLYPCKSAFLYSSISAKADICGYCLECESERINGVHAEVLHRAHEFVNALCLWGGDLVLQRWEHCAQVD